MINLVALCDLPVSTRDKAVGLVCLPASHQHHKELMGSERSDDSALYYQCSETGKVRWEGKRLSLVTRKPASQLREGAGAEREVPTLAGPWRDTQPTTRPIILCPHVVLSGKKNGDGEPVSNAGVNGDLSCCLLVCDAYIWVRA